MTGPFCPAAGVNFSKLDESSSSQAMSAYLFFEGTQPVSRPGRARPAPVATLPRRLLPMENSEECDLFFGELFDLAGLPRGAYRPGFLQRRLPACLRFLQVPNVGQGMARLREQPQARSQILGAVLLGVTDFYRDQEVFAQAERHFRQSWLPAREKIRVWSAACSDGQELYTVASVLDDLGILPEAELLGTDIRAEAIGRAHTGRYRPEELDRLPEAVRGKHFSTDRTGGWVQERLRQGIQWKQANLFSGAEAGPWHLILWRNMAIYLEREAAYPVWQSLVAELKPGGYLLVGKADYPPPGLGLVRVATCLYQKQGGVRR